MDQEPLSEQEPEEIRRQIEETRSSLSHKLESLEEEVSETVQGARDSVKDAVNNVKRTFDLRYQTQAHPLPMFGAAMLAGYLLGAISARSGSGAAPEGAKIGIGSGSTDPVSSGGRAASRVSGIVNRFDKEIRQTKNLLMTTLLSAAHEAVRSRVSAPVAKQLDSFVDNVMHRFGGTSIRGQVGS